MCQLMLNSKEYIRDNELIRLLNELSIITNKSHDNYISKINNNTTNSIKCYCRSIIKKGDPLLEKRLYYALYKGKKKK